MSRPPRTLLLGLLLAAATVTATVTAQIDDAELEARFQAGLAAADSGDYAAALDAWLPLAEAGYDTAAFNVGLLYRNGWGTKVDPGEALIWFWAAASQGNRDAQFNLGTMYSRGEGLSEPSPVEAWAWFSMAAEQGHPEASRARDAVASGLSVDELAQAHQLANVLSRRYLQR